MPLETLAGKAISNTYQKVVQTEGGFLADGTGSIVNNLSLPGNLYVSGTIYANNTITITQSYYSGSNIFGDAQTDTQTFTGSMLITGSTIWNISGSPTGYISPSTDGIAIGNSNSGTHIRVRNSNRTALDQSVGFGNPNFGWSTSDRITILTGGTTSGQTGIWIGSSANSNIFKVQGDSRVGINVATATATLHVSGTAGTSSALLISKSGSTVVDIQGSSGQLFSVTDSLTGSLFSVNTVAGLPVMEAFSDNTVNIGKFGTYPIKVVATGTLASITGSITGSLTGSVLGSSTSASFASTASYINSLTQSVIITGSSTNVTPYGATSTYIKIDPNVFNSRISFYDWDGGIGSRGGELEMSTYYGRLTYGSYNWFYIGNSSYKYLFYIGDNRRILISDSSAKPTNTSAMLTVRGEGVTNSTTAFEVQNSAGSTNAQIYDDGQWFIGTGNIRVSGTPGNFSFNTAAGNVANIGHWGINFQPLGYSGISLQLSNNISLTGSTFVTGSLTVTGSVNITGSAGAITVGRATSTVGLVHFQKPANSPLANLYLATPYPSSTPTNILFQNNDYGGGDTGTGSINWSTDGTYFNISNRTLFGAGQTSIDLTPGSLIGLSRAGAGDLQLNFLQGGVASYVIRNVSGQKALAFITDGVTTTTAEAARFTANSNFLIGTTSDTARLRVKGSGTTNSTTTLLIENANASASLTVTDDRIVTVNSKLQIGTFTPSTATGSSTIFTQGRISAGGGITLYNPAAGDDNNTGIFFNNGLQIYSGNATVALFRPVGGANSGFMFNVGGYAYNAPSGTGTVNTVLIDNAIIPTGVNSTNYNYVTVSPGITQGAFGTGTIRGFYFAPSIASLNTSPLIAFESTRGDVIIGGNSIVKITGSLSITGSAGTGSALLAYKSGSTVVDIQGSQGQLFSVIDSLTGSLMSVNDVSGLPILEVFSDDKVVMGTYGAPGLTVSGSSMYVPTASTAPTGGREGEFKLVASGSSFYVYGFIGGQWRSGSLF